MLLTDRVCSTLAVPEVEYELVNVADVDDVSDIDDDPEALDITDNDDDTLDVPESVARTVTDGVSEVIAVSVPGAVAETDSDGSVDDVAVPATSVLVVETELVLDAVIIVV